MDSGDLVILHLGSNNLTTKLLELGDILRSRYHVNTVIISSVLNREAHLRHITPEQFSTAAYRTITLKTSRTPTPMSSSTFTKDFGPIHQTHGTATGYTPTPRLVEKSARRAVFTALQTFTSR